MARYRYRPPSRWKRLLWWLEDWAPAGSLTGYVQFLAHRLRCWLRLKERGVADFPKRPEKRFLVVPIDMGHPLGVGCCSDEFLKRLHDAGIDPQWWRGDGP